MIEEVTTFVKMVVKSPMRLVCKAEGKHDWVWHGGGWIFSPKYTFRCARCGCRSTGAIHDLEKKGFKGKMRMRKRKGE